MSRRRTPIVLVTGPPASGKTHIAELLAAELQVPLVAKDAFKEVLYETLGVGDVAEANFVPEHGRPLLLGLQERHPFAPLEVHCTAREDVLVARYESRIGTRHAGHLDAERVEEISAAIRDGRNGPLQLGGASVTLDTTDLDTLELSSLLAAAREHVTANAAK